MKFRRVSTLLFAVAILPALTAAAEETAPADAPSGMVTPQYNGEGHLILPTNYRTWIFVGSSIGLSYFGEKAPGGPGIFHHIYMQPESYQHYLDTGKFADKTMLVMENYSPGNKEKNTAGALTEGKEFDVLHGLFEDKRVGLEVALKDEDRFEEGWAYFNFSSAKGLKETSASFPKAVCWSCHNTHGADDNVFVQFYPASSESPSKNA